jgi:hypothetical protein
MNAPNSDDFDGCDLFIQDWLLNNWKVECEVQGQAMGLSFFKG